MRKKEHEESDDSLWNRCCKKMKHVINYVDNMPYDKLWLEEKKKRFDSFKKDVLSLGEPNKMLEAIKYNPIGTDGIYNEILG